MNSFIKDISVLDNLKNLEVIITTDTATEEYNDDYVDDDNNYNGDDNCK